jgi:hypothetical protein
MTHVPYTTQLQAGLGMIEETRTLLDIWTSGMSTSQLYHAALQSGRFPGVSARRLQNIVKECFAPRLLVQSGRPAELLRELMPVIGSRDLQQILLVYTSRANPILSDFIRDVYWMAYSTGRAELTNQDAREFVVRANQLGLTTRQWSETTVRRVSAYLTGACADFGFLEHGTKRTRKILPFRLQPKAAIVLAYDLHFSGLGDNSIVGHPDWKLFGMERGDVIDELRRLALRGAFLVQAAGEVIRVSWNCKNVKDLSHALSQGEL